MRPTKITIMVAVGGALAVWTAFGAERPAAQGVPHELRRLAANAEKRTGWLHLRRYARSRRDPNERGLAYFVLGYREYEAQLFSAAADDLHEAAKVSTGLADAVTYFWAISAREAGNSHQAAEALKDFSSRFPQSPFRSQALEVLAQVLLNDQRPQEAIQVLANDPSVRRRPALALLQGQAFLQASRLQDAAHAFQDVYYAFPASPSARTAEEVLQDLRTKLGASYPEPGEQIQTARARILYNHRQYEESLDEYENLMKTRPGSSFAGRWQLGKAQCLLRLRRTSDAVEALSGSFAETPEMEAQRLALLVEVQARQGDEDAMLQALSQLERHSTSSPSYAFGLAIAGDYFYRQLDWKSAAQYYGRLVEVFPQDEDAPFARWRLAWCYRLQGDPVRAQEALRDYVTRYPDSSRVARALYWLGRFEERQGAPSEAKALYLLLKDRFAHSYYSYQTDERLKRLKSDKATSDALQETLAASFASVIPAQAVPVGLACVFNQPIDAVQPALTLQSLSLDELAEDYLRAALSHHHAASLELRLLLSRLEAARGKASLALFDAVKAASNYPDVEFSAFPKELWDLLYPRSYWSLVRRYARANRLDPYMVMGLIRQESAFNPRATSSANARGLMQLLPGTASRSRRHSSVRAAARRLYSPTYNIRAGCAHLRVLMKTFSGKPEIALAAYHAGATRVKQWMDQTSVEDPVEFLESIPIGTTRGYVERVLRDAAIYRQLMTGSPHFARCSSEAATISPHKRKEAPSKGRRAGTKRRKE